MNGTIPKFYEDVPLPQGYFDPPNPYVSAPSCGVNLLELSKYARQQKKRIVDLTREEVNRFSISRTI